MTLSPEHRDGLDRALKAVAEAEAGPTKADLSSAPLIDHWRALRSGSRTVVLWGNVSGHPLLGNDSTTTSPLLAIDVQAGWARTKSRWYVLGRPFAELETALAESLGVEKRREDFLQFVLPGYVPLEPLDQLTELLSDYIAWVRAFDQQDRISRQASGAKE